MTFIDLRENNLGNRTVDELVRMMSFVPVGATINLANNNFVEKFNEEQLKKIFLANPSITIRGDEKIAQLIEKNREQKTKFPRTFSSIEANVRLDSRQLFVDFGD